MLQLRNRSFGLLLLLTALVFTTKGQNRFTGKTNQKIWEAKDRNDLIYTLEILKKGNKDQKILALNGLQSWSDTSLRPQIIKLAKKGPSPVRQAAIEAIGQSRDSFYIAHLLKIYNARKAKAVKPTVLVALGKCITKAQINKLGEIKPVLQEGYAEGIYRAILKGAGSDQLTANMVELLIHGSKENRFYAAWYFARTNFRPTVQQTPDLISFMESTPGSDLAIPLLLGLAKANATPADSLKIRQVFYNYLKSNDYLTKVSALRAITIGKYSFANDTIVKLIGSNNEPALQLTYSEWLQKNCKSGLNVPPLSYQPAVLNILNAPLCNGIKIPLAPTNTQYDKMWKLKTLEHDFNQYPVIQQMLLQDPPAALKMEAMSSLIVCFGSKGFPENLKSDFYETVLLLINDADPGVLSTIANAISDKSIPLENGKISYANAFLGALTASKEKVKIPADMEALIDINKAISFINNTPAPKTETEWNHPIDWKYPVTIPEDVKVSISTTKGTFIITMTVNEAPGSVASILKLVESGYYNGKYFHRMVPDFVVQGGCPRGDGFGGQDYTIRSEFSSLKYTQGAVGLASAGPNTESCQWFFTHCPTPHLDGRYTIIGYVTEGMDVIHRLGVSDKMLVVKRVK